MVDTVAASPHFSIRGVLDSPPWIRDRLDFLRCERHAPIATVLEHQPNAGLGKHRIRQVTAASIGRPHQDRTTVTIEDVGR